MRVCFVTTDRIAKRMAGPGIRYWEFARRLAKEHEVSLVAWHLEEGIEAPFELGDRSSLDRALRKADIVVSQGARFSLIVSPFKRKHFVYDLYAPSLGEGLEMPLPRTARERFFHQYRQERLPLMLEVGDFFLCASETQRLYWLGMLDAAGRLDRANYARDAEFRRLIDVLPFGLPEEPPVRTRSVLKGVHPGIGKDDFLLVWGGGIWNWFDPLTLIRAVHQVRKQCGEVKLYFMGQNSPNQDIPLMSMAAQARRLADELGETDLGVFFGDWIPYEDRHNYLLEGDLGVSIHKPGIETTLAFRTRILDYLWAGLPILASRGDHFADLIDRRRLGWTVPCGEVDALAQAILDARADRAGIRERVLETAKEYTWERAVRPLQDYCAHPERTSPLEGWQAAWKAGGCFARMGLSALGGPRA